MSMPRSTGVPASEWIPISTDSEWSDKPRWSDDGKVVFFLSTRDGFSCVWGQRFDPVAGVIQGPPFAVAHFHNSRLSPQNVEPNSFQLSVAGDSIYLNLGEINASIWTGVVKRSAWASALDWFRDKLFFHQPRYTVPRQTEASHEIKQHREAQTGSVFSVKREGRAGGRSGGRRRRTLP